MAISGTEKHSIQNWKYLILDDIDKWKKKKYSKWSINIAIIEYIHRA